MLLAEVAPMSSTHSPSCEFSRREISPTPLERRVSFRGTAGFSAWFEEPRKNFITLSETDAMFKDQSPLHRSHRQAASTKTRAPRLSRPLSEYQSSPSGMRPLQWQCAGWLRD